MSEKEDSSLPAFVKAAIGQKAGIWLITPAGMVFGKPATFEEYLAVVEKRKPSPDSEHQKFFGDSELWLIDASLRSGGFSIELGAAIIRADHVSGWGLFTSLTKFS